METIFFLVNSPTCNQLSIGSWNIHGIANKFENEHCMNWLHLHDLVFLYELKTSQKFEIPGYMVYLSNNQNPHRGGTGLLIRNNLAGSITWMDISVDGQIWLKLSFLPNVLICGCYIPPAD